MYLNFYNLKKQPFHITPDPEFLYLSPSHREAKAAIIYGISQKKGFVAIIGAVGVGKTTILRSYLETADKKNLKLIYVFNPQLTFEELLITIYQELDLDPGHLSTLELVNRLNEILIEEYREGNTVVLIIDEVQNMPVDTLESLRMLSNLETSKDKLIQIVLVGQPEFKNTLDLHRLRQLKQRIVIRSTIHTLTKAESHDYLKFRLKMAGGIPDKIFSQQALNKIVNRAKGIPRTLNILSDNALITGFGYQQKPVSARIVKEIIRDLDGTEGTSFVRRWIPVALALALLIFVIAFGWSNISGLFHKTQTSPVPIQHETAKAQSPEANAGAPAGTNTQPSTFETNSQQTEPGTQQAQSEDPSRAITQQATTAPGQEVVQTKKTVVRGDTLIKLTNEIYGKSDNKTIGLVKEKNPQITNPDIIHEGSTIIFPDLPK